MSFKTKPMLNKGVYQILALKDDGTVWTWGRNFYGSLGDPQAGGNPRHRPSRVVNAENDGYLENITQIGLRSSTCFALHEDGHAYVWGTNHIGQHGTGRSSQGVAYPIPKKVVGIGGSGTLENIEKIAPGISNTLALLKDATACRLGSVGVPTRLTYDPLGTGAYVSGVKDIAIPENGFYVLLNDGTIFEYGAGQYSGANGTNLGKVVDENNIVLDNIVDVGCGIALRSDGTVWTWGNNQFGKLGIGDPAVELQSYAAPVAGLTNIVKIIDSAYERLVIDQAGNVFVWGRNVEGMLIAGDPNDKVYTPTLTTAFDGAVEIFPGYNGFVFYKQDGTVWVTGSNALDLANNGESGSTDRAVQVMQDEGEPFLLFEGAPIQRDPSVWVKVPKGATVDLRATVLPADYELSPAHWFSDDDSIASVNSEGVVTGISLGQTYISVTTSDRFHEATIGVAVVESNIEDLRIEVKVRPGRTVELLVLDEQGQSYDNVVWESIDPDIATVDATGCVTGITQGVTVITATYDSRELDRTHIRVI